MAKSDTVGRRVRRARLEREWTQSELGVRLGWEQQHVSRLEADRHDPRLSTLLELARALRVKVCDLVPAEDV